MSNKSMTALISAFGRAYHNNKYATKIFSDPISVNLFNPKEYEMISKHMVEGINFFHSTFDGTPDEALNWIVNQYLAPTTLGRSAFNERALALAKRLGVSQYVILGAGYDTFPYRQPEWAKDMTLFEMDLEAMILDKTIRLKQNDIIIPHNVNYLPCDFKKKNSILQLGYHHDYNKGELSFVSMLGVSYYLKKENIHQILAELSSLMPKGSSIVFDYPDERSSTSQAGERMLKQRLLAESSKEPMEEGYSYLELERLFEAHGFLIYEHLCPLEITEEYFKDFNRTYPEQQMTAFDNINYVLAVKN